MLPLTFCEWKCWQRKILSDVQPSFSCRWLQKPKVTFLLITKIRISFEKLWPRFCIWGRLKRCLLFLLRKMALFRTWPLWFPQKVFFSWKRSYFVQMSRCVFFLIFMLAIYIYIRRFIPILFCHLYMNVSYRFRLKSSTVGFKDVGLTVPGWMARSWTPGVRCSRRVPSTGGPAMCRMCALISDEAVPWTGRSFCPCFSWHVYFQSIRRCSSPSFRSGGVMEYGEAGMCAWALWVRFS